MEDIDLAYTPVWQLRQLLDSRRVSPVELTELYLRRVEALNPKLNAFLTVTADEALASARSAEERISRGQSGGSLLGIPISIKDLELTKGVRTTLGSLVFRDTVPDYDSVVVERIKAAGAIILGKTNTPEFGLAGTTENRLGDACRNPWNTEHTSGGSSGGAAAATASAMCPIAAGSDGGGSIRIPSSFCGLYGIKPTLGRVPRYGGYGEPAPNLGSQSGPIARTVKDAAILLQVLAGHDSRDVVSLREPPPDFVAGLDDGVRGLRLAWSPDLGYAVAEPEVVEITSRAARVFEELGCEVDQPSVELEDPEIAFRDIFGTTAYASYAKILEERSDELTDYARSTIEYGRGTTGADLARALRVMQVLRAQLDGLLEEHDLLLTPTMAMPAPPIGQHPERIGGKQVQKLWAYAFFTAVFNITGLPAATVPCGFSGGGLPIGLHIIGRRGEEGTVLRASAALEQARPWAQHRPPVS